MKFSSLAFGLLAIGCLDTNLVSAQATQATRNTATGLQEKTAPLTAGPEDKQERVAPGKIDADASREFKETKSGLKYRILRKSDGRKPKASDAVEVHYKGWLDNKTIFDSSYRRGQTSIERSYSRVDRGHATGRRRRHD
jgi:FKBP-type peptidyl-prolyl cis-trans isomerase